MMASLPLPSARSRKLSLSLSTFVFSVQQQKSTHECYSRLGGCKRPERFENSDTWEIVVEALSHLEILEYDSRIGAQGVGWVEEWNRRYWSGTEREDVYYAGERERSRALAQERGNAERWRELKPSPGREPTA